MINNNFQPIDYIGAGNGIIMSSHSMGKDSPLHFDARHIRNLATQLNGKIDMPDHLGIIEGLTLGNPWYKSVQNTVFNLGIDGSRNIQYISNENGDFTYDVPLNDTDVCGKIIEVKILGDPSRPGIDGSEIIIKVDKFISGANSVLMIGSKNSHVELHVQEDPRGSEAEGYLYITKFVSPDNDVKFVNPFYLQKGRTVRPMIALSYEDNRNYDSRTIPGSAVRRFFNTAGNMVNQKWFSVTRHAGLKKVDKNNILTYTLEQHTKMMRLDIMKTNTAGAGIKGEGRAVTKRITELYGTNREECAKKYTKDIFKTTFVPQLEMYYMALIDRENALYKTWGNGGTIYLNSDRGYKLNLPIGLFRQAYKLANRYDYELDNFNLDKLSQMIFSLVGKGLDGNSKKTIKLKTGMGGLKIARKQAAANAWSQMPNVMIDGNEFLTNKGGDNLALGFQMGFGVIYNPLGNLSIELTYAPELDAFGYDDSDKDDFDNPYVSGHRLSSYVFMVDDLNSEGSSVVEYRNENLGDDFTFFIEEGKLNYLGTDQSKYQRVNSIHNAGYNVYIEKAVGAYILMKPQNVFMYLPRNPKTKRPMGDHLTASL